MPIKYYPNSTAVILDDHKMFAESLSMLLERMEFFESVHVLESENDVLSFFRIKQRGPSFLFVDYFMPGINILHLIADVKRLYPHVHVVINTSLINPTLIKKLLLQKPDGFLSKTAGISELIECIDAVRKNQLFVSSNIQTILDNHDQEVVLVFTAKELEILTYIYHGKSILETAEILNLSRHTVITHRRNMLAKTKCKSVTELLAFAVSNSIIQVQNF